jgi:hypothetical protein
MPTARAAYQSQPAEGVSYDGVYKGSERWSGAPPSQLPSLIHLRRSALSAMTVRRRQV